MNIIERYFTPMNATSGSVVFDLVACRADFSSSYGWMLAEWERVEPSFSCLIG
jgi:hypothetical protein